MTQASVAVTAYRARQQPRGPGRAWHWLVQGMGLWRGAVWQGLLLALLPLIGEGLLQWLPVVGVLVSKLLTPLLGALTLRWLHRHWRLNHASTGLRQMLQADLRLTRYRLLYHALGLLVGGLMLAWAWPQLPPLGESTLARGWLPAVALGSVGYALWAGRQAWRRIAYMRAQLRQLDGGGG